MNLTKILALLNSIMEGADSSTIQEKLDALVAHYGHGVVEYARYVLPGAPRSADSTHFLTLTNRAGANVEIEFKIAKLPGFLLDLLLERL